MEPGGKGPTFDRRPVLAEALETARRPRRQGRLPAIVAGWTACRRDAFTSSAGLMAHGTGFIVAELGRTLTRSSLTLRAAIAEKERKMDCRAHLRSAGCPQGAGHG